jgi:hypothetical protein
MDKYYLITLEWIPNIYYNRSKLYLSPTTLRSLNIGSSEIKILERSSKVDPKIKASEWLEIEYGPSSDD